MFDKEQITLKLTNDQALVFFDFLTRLNENTYCTIFQSEAEQKVIWNMQTQLEKTLAEPLMENYEELLKIARNHLIAEQ